MRCDLQLATAADVADLLSLHAAVNERLTTQYGNGFWISRITEKSALFAMRNSSVYIARYEGRPIATLTLATKKPWAIDKNARKYFASGKSPLYLTAMAVHPDVQRRGIGRLCVEAARRIALEWPCDAIRLDAYDAAAGAGEFYRKCGFREAGRATYRLAPLIYFEMLL
jgi:GNAT superfamily N-acetyltransferase